MPTVRSATKSKPRASTKTRPVEGATLATIDSFMDMIGERQDAPLVKLGATNKATPKGEPFAVRAIDFFSIVFAKKD